MLLIGLFASGILGAVAGLFSLYPRLRDAAPRVSVAGVVRVTIGVLAVLSLFLLYGVARPRLEAHESGLGVDEALVRVAFQTLYAGLGLGFLFFAAASLRDSGVSRVVAGLATFVALVANFLAWVLGVTRPAMGLISSRTR